MKVSDLINSEGLTLSFEVFPPKNSANYESVHKAAMAVGALKPDYMSVTYGANGSTSKNTVSIAKDIQDAYGVPVIAHLTCVGATRESIHKQLDAMKAAGVENVLALRGDKPADFEGEPFIDFFHASELAEEIASYGDFCIGGACYPETHPDASGKMEDIRNLKIKQDSGCQYLTTQMFFDNNIFYNFLYKTREAGVTIPVIPGIMPITRSNQVVNAVKLSGCNVPERFKMVVDRFGDDPAAMQQAGIAYATDQIIDLYANGIDHIHVYSMNKPEVVSGILSNLSEILK